MPPRTIRPRNLRIGNYRGGNRPIDLFWRVRLGIEGTPMPAATLKQADDPNSKGLTEDDIWDIVNYVQSLPDEVINNPHDAVPANLRERL
jgi:mono/diheme cytochrome c family protein